MQTKEALPSLTVELLGPAANYGDLERALVHDIKPDSWRKGACVHGRIHSSAPRWNGQFSILDFVAEEDGTEMVLFIGYSATSLQEVGKLYPPGALVVVKQPLVLRRNKLVLVTGNPESVEILKWNPGETTLRDAKLLRDMGNKAFKDVNFYKAIEFYGLSISSAKEDEDGEQTLLGLSNRAEARLQLEQWEDALADADAALACCSSHGKSLSRKARALLGLRQYVKACDFFEKAVANSDGSSKEAMRKFHQECLALKQQSVHGIYNLTRYFSGAEQSLPSLADFVGPVEIKSSTTRGGRGLFVTRDVKLGELLFVSNAAVKTWCGRTAHFNQSQELATRLTRACINSPRVRAQVSHLIDAEKRTGLEVPNVDLYQPNSSSAGAGTELPVDVNHILGTVNMNSELFFHENEDQNNCGITPLLSFVNHSCNSNASAFNLGDVLFVVAARAIKSGEEILRSYYNSLEDPSVCLERKYNCEMCNILTGNPWKKIYDKYKIARARLDTVRTDQEAEQVTQLLVQIVRDVEKQMKHRNPSEELKSQLYCIFVTGYLFAHVKDEPGIPPAVRIMEALRTKAPGARRCLNLLLSLCQYTGSADLSRAKQLLHEQTIGRYGLQVESVAETILLRKASNSIPGHL